MIYSKWNHPRAFLRSEFQKLNIRLGILASKRNMLRKIPDITVFTESFTELAELVLKKNCFEFNNRFKKKNESTAIGTKFAPPYAIIFMAALEE